MSYRLGILVFLISGNLLATGFTQSRPNILVIVADDLGFGDLSCYGAEAIETPNLDRLAREGLRLTNAHSSASTCTPTRFSILTGIYAFRFPGTGVAPPNAPALVQSSMETLPRALKRAGYATAIVGKWHLGLGDPAPDWNGKIVPGPLEAGFDHCLILPTTNDRVPQVLVQDQSVRNLDPHDPLWVGDRSPAQDHPTGLSHRRELRLDWRLGHNGTIHNGVSRIGYYTGGTAARFRDEDLADIWVSECRDWIGRQKQPFFLMVCAHDIHVPRLPHERFVGKSQLGSRGDAILELDWTVGSLLKILENDDLATNTLVVFCSDNGPILDDGYSDEAVESNGSHRPAGPYRAGKYSVFEGGTRTPFVTWWPGTISPGRCDELVSTIDLPASLCRVASATWPKGDRFDSQDLSPVLMGKPGSKGRDELVTQDNQAKTVALRAGRWKLIRTSKKMVGDPVRDDPTELMLFDLETDPGESHDLAAMFPDQAMELNSRLDEIVKSPTPKH